MLKRIVITCGAVALVVAATGQTRASGVAAGTTYLTFSRPVALPGTELAAGTYIFELADPDLSRSVVRVMTHDRRRQLLLAFTVPVSRPLSMKAGTASVSLGEAGRGVAPPIKAWFPADESIGHAFMYVR